jgi:hypothetical protein
MVVAGIGVVSIKRIRPFLSRWAKKSNRSDHLYNSFSIDFKFLLHYIDCLRLEMPHTLSNVNIGEPESVYHLSLLGYSTHTCCIFFDLPVFA